MDCLTLLAEARDAGLELIPEGDHLKIRGPQSAEPLVRRLLENKDELLQHLRFRNTLPVSETKTSKTSLLCGKVRIAEGVLETGIFVIEPAHPLAAFNWDGPYGYFPHPAVVRKGIRHKNEDCAALESWKHVWGERFCLRCWPPTDPLAVSISKTSATDPATVSETSEGELEVDR